jgi:hypothetical protein
MSKETLRKAIQRHTKEFLDRGGVIEVIPRVIFCPTSMDWARKRGMDYTPWNYLGGLGYGHYVQDVVNLEEGCFMTKPAPFEGDGDR